eukprot:scaffold7566_cov122-Isochrysis_galbana.AAC.4
MHGRWRTPRRAGDAARRARPREPVSHIRIGIARCAAIDASVFRAESSTRGRTIPDSSLDNCTCRWPQNTDRR